MTCRRTETATSGILCCGACRLPHVLLVVLSLTTPAYGQHGEATNSDYIREANENTAERAEHPVSASDQDSRLQQAARLMVQQTNTFRRANDLSEVEPNEALTKAAIEFASFMARTGKYGHTADGKRPAQRAASHGYEVCIVSENIAYVYKTAPLDATALAKRFVEGWKKSPEHRENILGEHVTNMGVGLARDDKTGYHFAVQLFGRPKSEAIRFTIESRASNEVQYEIVTQGATETFTLPPRVVVTHTRCQPPRVQLTGRDDMILEIRPRDVLIVRENEQGRLSLERQ